MSRTRVCPPISQRLCRGLGVHVSQSWRTAAATEMVAVSTAPGLALDQTPGQV